MSKGTAKSKGVFHMGSEATYQPQSTMRLEGKHAKATASHAIGKKVKMVVMGTKMSHSVGNDGVHSSQYDLSNVHPEGTEGPQKKASNNDEKD